MRTLHLHVVAEGPSVSRGALPLRTLQVREEDGEARLEFNLLSLAQRALFDVASQPGPRQGHGPRALRKTAVGELGEVLLLDAVAAEAAGPLAALRGVAGLRRSLARTFSALGCADLGPQLLPWLAGRLPRGTAGSGAAERLAELGRLYQRYRGLLGPQRLDRAMAFGQGTRALRVESAAEIVVSGLHRLPPWDALPTPHRLMQALAALAKPGPEPDGAAHAPRLVRVVLPGLDEERPALEQALRPLYDAIYERHTLNIELDSAPLGPHVAGAAAETPWGRFLRGLFLPLSAPPQVRPGEVPADKLTLSPLPNPRSEARSIARAVTDLLGRGITPSDIAIVAESASRRARLVQELLRYDIPVEVRPPALHAGGLGLFPDRDSEPLPPPLALLLGLYELIGNGQGLAREGLIQLLTTRYLRWPLSSTAAPTPPWQLARALRGAGVRELALVAGAESTGELRRRVDEWQRQQRKGAGGDSALLHHLESILGELRTLPEQAPLNQHVTALRRLCERLELRQRAVAPEGGWLGHSPLDRGEDEDGPGALSQAELLAAECRALGRDQAALAWLEQILDELPRRGQELRLQDEALSRERFAALLRAALLRPRPGAGLGGAGLGVEVGGLGQVAPRRFAHLFFAGLLDGELPAAVAEDQLLDDEDRRQCNRLLDAPVWPLAQHAGPRAALFFAELLCHADAVHLSWPLADEEGRPLLRSPFVDTVLHAAAASEPEPLREPLLPGLDEARHPTELWTRAGQAAGPAGPARPAETPATLAALLSRDRRRARRLAGRIELEAARAAWFAAWSTQQPSLQPGPLCGQLSDPMLIAALAPRLPGSRARPLSASALEDYARCPFRFFVYRVLQAAPIPEGGDDLDPLARGNLYHKALETFFADRRDRKRFPLKGDDDDRAALDRALESALSEFAAAERGGHKALFQVRVRRLRTELWQLILREAAAPIEPGCTPALLEHKFGPLAITSTGEESADSALHIGGVVDRIDIGPGRALVLDYKTGRLKRYQEYLRGELLETSFQLPLYAAAVQADPAVLAAAGGSAAPQVTARFYAVRQAQVTEPLDDPTLITLDLEGRRRAGEHNVAEAAYRLWRRLRSGDFRVAPRTCDGCGLESVCRIAVPPALGDETAEEASQSSSSSTPKEEPTQV